LPQFLKKIVTVPIHSVKQAITGARFGVSRAPTRNDTL
jgi:hypothetical protein